MGRGELRVASGVVNVDFIEERSESMDPAARLAEFAAKPFVLTAAPLARLLLLSQPGQTALALAAHHSVADGWSFMVMLRELLHLYDALVAGQRPALSAAPSYVHFMRAEKMANEADVAQRLAAIPARRFRSRQCAAGCPAGRAVSRPAFEARAGLPELVDPTA